jgi:hypothetical protein
MNPPRLPIPLADDLRQKHAHLLMARRWFRLGAEEVRGRLESRRSHDTGVFDHTRLAELKWNLGGLEQLGSQ